MPPSHTRWQAGQRAICYCLGDPRKALVLSGHRHAGLPPTLEIDGEPHECGTATRPREAGMAGTASDVVRLDADTVAAARSAAAQEGTTLRSWIGRVVREKTGV